MAFSTFTGKRRPDPFLGERNMHMPAPPPDPGGRRMHKRKLVLRGPGERNRLPPRVPLSQRPSKLRPGHGAPRKRIPRMLRELGEVDPRKLPPERGKPLVPHAPGQNGPQPEIVRGSADVLGTAQQPAPHNRPIVQRLSELPMLKPAQTRPNSDIWRIDVLGLNGHEPPNNTGHSARPVADEELPSQVGPIERPQ